MCKEVSDLTWVVFGFWILDFVQRFSFSLYRFILGFFVYVKMLVCL